MNEYNYPDVLKMTAADLRARHWFIDATSDDISFDSPDGSSERPYPAESTK